MSKKQLLELKELYAKSNSIIQEISAGSIFDQEFSGLYNQKYLIAQIDKETKAIGQFNHNSTIVFAKLSSKVTKEIGSKKGILLATRTVAKLFLKTSRRSDIIAHYGDGIFAMVLKYTDIENAKRATNRLEDLVTAAHFFFDDKDIELGISIGIAKILPIRTTDDTLKCVLTALKQVDANPNSYLAVCAGDENEG
jgi:diguanylate cyclase (GGDEF)-like protein